MVFVLHSILRAVFLAIFVGWEYSNLGTTYNKKVEKREGS